MLPSRLSLLLLGLLATAGCKKAQSFADAMRVICEAPNQVAGQSLAQKATAIAAYVDRNVTNKKARAFMKEMAASDPAARPRLLAEARARAGLDPLGCALADLWRMPPSTPIPPAPPPEEAPAPPPAALP